jgi:hypothetical protein
LCTSDYRQAGDGQRKKENLFHAFFEVFKVFETAMLYHHCLAKFKSAKAGVPLPQRYNHSGDGGIVESVEIDPDNL